MFVLYVGMPLLFLTHQLGAPVVSFKGFKSGSYDTSKRPSRDLKKEKAWIYLTILLVGFN
jgi:hypothetical protein